MKFIGGGYTWYRPTSLKDLFQIRANYSDAVIVMGAQTVLGKNNCQYVKNSKLNFKILPFSNSYLEANDIQVLDRTGFFLICIVMQPKKKNLFFNQLLYKKRKGLFLVKKEHQSYYQNLEFVDPTVERRDIIFNIYYEIKPLFKSTFV